MRVVNMKCLFVPELGTSRDHSIYISSYAVHADENKTEREHTPKARWRNGLARWSTSHAIWKDPGSNPTYDQWSFSPVTRFLHSLIEPPTPRFVPCALIN